MFNNTLMILHYHKHNKTPVWAHNHDLFDEHKYIPVNLSDPHGRRSPAIQNEKAGD